MKAARRARVTKFDFFSNEKAVEKDCYNGINVLNWRFLDKTSFGRAYLVSVVSRRRRRYILDGGRHSTAVDISILLLCLVTTFWWRFTVLFPNSWTRQWRCQQNFAIHPIKENWFCNVGGINDGSNCIDFQISKPQSDFLQHAQAWLP